MVERSKKPLVKVGGVTTKRGVNYAPGPRGANYSPGPRGVNYAPGGTAQKTTSAGKLRLGKKK